MNDELETSLNQEDVNATPKPILEVLFSYNCDLICKYGEEECLLENRLKNYTETYAKYIQDKIWGTDPVQIKWYKKQIQQCKESLKAVKSNLKILSENNLKIDKILEYGWE